MPYTGLGGDGGNSASAQPQSSAAVAASSSLARDIRLALDPVALAEAALQQERAEELALSGHSRSSSRIWRRPGGVELSSLFGTCVTDALLSGGDETSNISNNAIPGCLLSCQKFAKTPSFVVDRNVLPLARLKNDCSHLALPISGPGE